MSHRGARPAARPGVGAGPGAREPGQGSRGRVASVAILVRAISINGCLEPVLGGVLSVRAGLPSVLCRPRQQVRSTISSHAWMVRASLIKAGDTLVRLRHALVHASESVLSPAR